MGVLHFTPTSFYEASPKEITLAFEGYREQQQYAFFLNEIALRNSIGAFFGGKNFKAVNPFKGAEKQVNEGSKQDKELTFTYLLDKFETKVGE